MTRTYDLGIDNDGVLHSFGGSFKYFVISENIRTEAECSAPIEDYHFYRKWGISDDEFPQICHDGVNAGIIFMHGEPFPGARSCMRQLKASGHRLHIITDRAFGEENFSEDLTRQWLDLYDIPYDTLTFSADKTCVRTDFMLDDKIENYDDLEAVGCTPYLYDRPWNQDTDCKRRRVFSFRQFVDVVEWAST